MSRTDVLNAPAVCSSQIGGKQYNLGNYDDEADAARAFDRVTSVLGRPPNLPEEDESEIVGPSSEGADQAVAEAVKAAENVMDTDKAKQKAASAKKVHAQKLRALHALKTNKPANSHDS